MVVVGGGVAGTAAALAAAQGGARVTLVNGGTGASVLAGGALDDVPWEENDASAEPTGLAETARAVLDALAGYAVGESRALVAATTGLVRPARGVDRALLDLASLESPVVLVPDFAHGAWDAPVLARTWTASRRAGALGIRFVPVAASLLARIEEHACTGAELAGLHDDPVRLDWLADRIREARAAFAGDVGAMIVPPWLGVAHERATALSASVGFRCGEALGGVGGPSGLRFEHARDRALTAAGVTILSGRAARVTAAAAGVAGVAGVASQLDGAWSVEVAGRDEALGCDAVVLATGGLLGGGLEYSPSASLFANALPDHPGPLLRVTCEAPVTIGAFGRALVDPSSLFGAAPETHAWPHTETPLLDHAGVMVGATGEVAGATTGLYATGELAAGPAHTWLAALAHGARAGTAALVTGAPRRIS